MADFDPAAYGPALADLLRRAPLNPLGAGEPDASVRPALAALGDEAFCPDAVRDPAMTAACRAALWLRFNYLNESHTLSQDIDTPEGSFWHGILHRREGDFDNAKYWFRRVGAHTVFGPLQKAARDCAAGGVAKDQRAIYLVSQKAWDPFAFIDLCAAGGSGEAPWFPLCRVIQRREWELLFDYCWRHAVGD
jgi:hypothetical protein